MPTDLIAPPRRWFLRHAGKATLSAGAILLLAGCSGSRPAKAAAPAADASILNAALGAEQEAVAAYQVGAESGLLSKPALDLAVQFQGHHKQHAEVLAPRPPLPGGLHRPPIS